MAQWNSGINEIVTTPSGDTVPLNQHIYPCYTYLINPSFRASSIINCLMAGSFSAS